MFAPPNNVWRKEALQTSQAKYTEYINIALKNRHEAAIEKQLGEIVRLASPLFREGEAFTWDQIWLVMNENKNNNYAKFVEDLDNYLQTVIPTVVIPKSHEYPDNYIGGRRRHTKRSKVRRKSKRRSAKRA